MFPHILRSVGLIGVDSVYAPAAKRERAWETLSSHLDREKLALMTRVEPLHRVPQIASEIIEGKTRGRIVVNISSPNEQSKYQVARSANRFDQEQ